MPWIPRLIYYQNHWNLNGLRRTLHQERTVWQVIKTIMSNRGSGSRPCYGESPGMGMQIISFKHFQLHGTPHKPREGERNQIQLQHFHQILIINSKFCILGEQPHRLWQWQWQWQWQWRWQTCPRASQQKILLPDGLRTDSQQNRHTKGILRLSWLIYQRYAISHWPWATQSHYKPCRQSRKFKWHSNKSPQIIKTHDRTWNKHSQPTITLIIIPLCNSYHPKSQAVRNHWAQRHKHAQILSYATKIEFLALIIHKIIFRNNKTSSY